MSERDHKQLQHAVIAFLSGVLVETLYALGVLFIGEHRALESAGLAVVWGAAFLIGVHESFKTRVAAALYCVGLGAGTLLGVWLGS